MEADKQPKNMSDISSTQVVFQVGRSVVWMHNKISDDASNISVDYKTAWDEELKQLALDLEFELPVGEELKQLALDLDNFLEGTKHRQKTRPKTHVRAGRDLELVKSLRAKKIVKSLRAKKKSNRLDTIDEDYQTVSYDSYKNLKLIKEDEQLQRDADNYQLEYSSDDSSEDGWNKLFDDYKYTLSQYSY